MDSIDRLIVANETLIRVNRELITEHRKFKRYVVFTSAVVMTFIAFVASLSAWNNTRLARNSTARLTENQRVMLQILHDEGWCPTSTAAPVPPPPDAILPQQSYKDPVIRPPWEVNL